MRYRGSILNESAPSTCGPIGPSGHRPIGSRPRSIDYPFPAKSSLSEKPWPGLRVDFDTIMDMILSI